jgi:hypothetical protein
MGLFCAQLLIDLPIVAALPALLRLPAQHFKYQKCYVQLEVHASLEITNHRGGIVSEL